MHIVPPAVSTDYEQTTPTRQMFWKGSLLQMDSRRGWGVESQCPQQHQRSCFEPHRGFQGLDIWDPETTTTTTTTSTSTTNNNFLLGQPESCGYDYAYRCYVSYTVYLNSWLPKWGNPLNLKFPMYAIHRSRWDHLTNQDMLITHSNGWPD